MEIAQQQKAEREKSDLFLILSRYATTFMAFVVIAFGLSVIIGWHGYISPLIQYETDTISMVYNTAVSFTLAGIAVLGLNYHFRKVALILSGFIFIFGMMNVCQYIFGIDLRIDQIFFKYYDKTAQAYSGRMAPNTAICFILVAMTIFLLAWNKFPRFSIPLAGGLSIIMLSLGILFTSGYLNVYEWGSITSMAQNTAIGFILLSIGLIALSFHKGLIYRVDWMRGLPLIFTFCVLVISILLSQKIHELQRLNQYKSNLPLLVLIFGSMLALFLGLLLRFAQLAVRAAKVTKQTSLLVRGTLESTADGIIAIDKEGRVIDYNQRFLKLWKLSPEKIKNCNRQMLINAIGKQLIDKEKFTLKLNQFSNLSNEESFDVLRLKNGAFFEQYSKPQFLRNEVVGRVLSYRDITLRKRLEQELLRQSTHDSLTGLPNRGLLLDLLNRAIENAKRTNKLVGVFLLDIDRFSHVNDTFGRTKGDMFLKLVAERFQEHLGSQNILGRMGGDEFLVVACDFQRPENAVSILTHLMKSLTTPFQFYGHHVNLTCSVGVTFFPKDGTSIDMLLTNADIAMLRAKENGRNKFQFYTQGMNTYTIEQIELENQLHEAVEKKQFELYYQPLFELKDSKPIGVEALIRWRHPTRGVISPINFIPLAEEIGLIQKIGEWVLMTACQQTKQWHDEGFNDLKVAVNISGQQFKYGALDKVVANILSKIQLKPDTLEIELTESILIQGAEFVINALDKLRATGVDISIDDFGTGYSCLNYLKRFPIDKLKIDHSFVSDVTKNEEGRALIKVIIAMAKNLNLTVLAEGIETEEQLKVLKELKCDYGQGYYLSKPLTAEGFRKFFSEYHSKS